MGRYSLRRIGGVVLAAAAVGLGVGVWQGGVVGGGGGGGTGTIWYIATTGSDVNPGTSASPFLTMNKCYQTAAQGDTCYLKTGSYGDQDISSSPKSLSSSAKCRWKSVLPWQDGTTTTQDLTGCVLFTPAPAAAVTVNSVHIEVPYVYLLGLTMSTAQGAGQIVVRHGGGDCPTPQVVTDIIVRNTTAVGFLTMGQQYTSFIGDTFNHINELANDYSDTLGFCPGSPNEPYQVGHFQIDSTLIENVQYTTSGQHIECIHAWSADHVNYTNDRFYNCAQLDISQQGDSDKMNYIRIENDVFDVPCSHQDFAATGGCNASAPNWDNNTNPAAGHELSMSRYDTFISDDHWTIAFNSFPTQDYPNLTVQSGTFSDVHEYGNIIGAYPNASFHCNAQLATGLVMDYNFFFNEPAGFTGCGTHSTLNANQGIGSVYSNDKNFDYTVQAGLSPSPIDLLVPANLPEVPATDLLGNARPDVGATNVDAGAYEKTGS